MTKEEKNKIFKNFELELPEIKDYDKNQIIKELQKNVNMQLEIIQDRMNQPILVDLEEIEEILDNTAGIIEECYSTPKFNPSMYKKFSILSLEYQRLSIRYESTSAEDKFLKLEKKTNELENKTKDFEGDLKNHLGTLVGLFLTFTLIPTAISGITLIDGKYILQFVATVVLFGILMVTYIYVLNHVKISKASWIVMSIIILITILLWSIVCFSDLDISSKSSDFKPSINQKIPDEIIENNISIERK